MRLAASLVAILLLACAPPMRPVPGFQGRAQEVTLDRIPKLEARRSLGEGDPLIEDAMVGGEVVRARAYLALARMQIDRTVPKISIGLSAPEPEIRKMSAFAAGELGLSWQPLDRDLRSTLTEAVISALPQEDDPDARRFEYEALGKLGGARALAHLAAALPDPTAATALGVAARRGEKLPNEAFQNLLKPPPKESVFAFAYALAASKDPRAHDALIGFLGDSSADVRAVALKGLGEVGDPKEAAKLARLDDPEPRVVAESVRALAKLAKKCTAECPPLEALARVPSFANFAKTDPARAIQPLLAFSQEALPPSARGLLEETRVALKVQADSEDAPWLDCRMAAAEDRIAVKLDAVRQCGFGKVSEARALGLGLDVISQEKDFPQKANLDELVALVHSPEASLRLKAVQALGAAGKPEAAKVVRPLIESDDLVLAVNAAATAGQLKDKEAIRPIAALIDRVQKLPEEAEGVAQAAVDLEAKQLVEPLRAWLKAPHANLRIQAAKALTQLTGTTVYPDLEVNNTAQKILKVPAKGTKLHVVTAKGELVIELDTEQAPQTSANFAELAKKGFFKGLTFHRVVPDFVVQGGDPRGDGEGGPGYTIPCEVNPRRYVRGTVGVALSGKDTGGSQFFVTFSPQPHLDGRYTAFGEVVSGMEVAEKLSEGAPIREIRVE